MPDFDPYAISYLAVERRCWTDIMPGLMFCFCQRAGCLEPGEDDHSFIIGKIVWIVVAKDSVPPGNRDDQQRYLLLSSSGLLVWHEGELGWIRRIADPGCELRTHRWREEARARHLQSLLRDDALALGA